MVKPPFRRPPIEAYPRGRFPLTAPAVIAFVLSFACGGGWCCLANAGFYGPHGPGFYFYPNYPWLGWLSVAFLALSVFLVIREVRRISTVDARFLAGQCVHCGFDLRASPERCPECGRER